MNMQWPDKLRLRDTGLYDDMGGLGQRIYTTAGVGYEKTEYVRADLSQASVFDLVSHLERQRAFSLRTFGPGVRTAGVCDHIRKELAEIEADPSDVAEWVDVILLALDGAWRAGYEPAQIAEAIAAKQTKNESRTWPDWRTADPNKAIEHDRSADQGIAP